MKCDECGHESPDNALFCMNCGKRFLIDNTINKKVVDEPHKHEKYGYHAEMCGSSIFFNICGVIWLILSVFFSTTVASNLSEAFMLGVMIALMVNAILFFCLGSIAKKIHITQMEVSELYDRMIQKNEQST